MSKKNKKNQSNEAKAAQEEIQSQESLNDELQATDTDDNENADGKVNENDDLEQRIEQLEQQLEYEKKEYAFKLAEFDNYRKRTIKEKADLIKNGAESAMRDLLPVVDDLERALDAINKGGDLIYNKFMKYLESQHVTAIESTGKDFDTDIHDAVTTFPAPDPSMKGKVIDTAVKGYMINDKVLRFAKVIVGS